MTGEKWYGVSFNVKLSDYKLQKVMADPEQLFLEILNDTLVSKIKLIRLENPSYVQKEILK